MRRLRAVALLLGVLAVSSSARAQSEIDTSTVTAPPPPGVSPALDSARALRGASLTVSLYTYGPSDLFYERFGHGAIGIRDSLSGRDVAFNWGLFSFEAPNFLMRFLAGDSNYRMAGFLTQEFNASYQADNRTIRQQVLALSPVERAALLEFVLWNAQPGHEFYRYDYYSDNCGTRVRDALDRVLRGQLHKALDVPGSGRTWRGETARILEYQLPLYAGIQIALGRHADEPLTKWREEFLPEHLATHIESLVLTNAEGRRYRLVERDTVLYTSTRVPVPTDPPSWVAMAVLLGFTLAGIVAALADARHVAARLTVSVLAMVWYLVGGLLGTALLLAATVTKHAPYMGANSTLFSLQPLLLVAAVLAPVTFWRGRASRAAVGVCLVIAALSVFGLLLQIVPAWSQSSGVVLAVVVPVHVAFAIAVWRLSRRTPGRPL